MLSVGILIVLAGTTVVVVREPLGRMIARTNPFTTAFSDYHATIITAGVGVGWTVVGSIVVFLVSSDRLVIAPVLVAWFVVVGLVDWTLQRRRNAAPSKNTKTVPGKVRR